MDQAVYDVFPWGADGWRVLFSDGLAASRVFSDKTEAIARAKELAKAAGNGRIVIRGLDGKVQAMHAFHAVRKEASS
jgi:hypothetical protein